MRTDHGTNTERLDTLSRQVHYLLEGGKTFDEAIKHLQHSLPPDAQNSVEQLKNLLSPCGVKPQRANHHYAGLQTLMQALKDEGGDSTHLFTHFIHMRDDLRQQLKIYWDGIMGIVTYGAAVLAIAAIVLSLFSIFVFPSFVQLYDSFDAQLPQFTLFTIALGKGVAPVLIVVIALLLTGLGLLIHTLKTSICRFAPITGLLLHLPGLNRIIATYNTAITLAYAQLLKRSGLSGEQALQKASSLVPGPFAKNMQTHNTPSHLGGPRYAQDTASTLRLARTLGTLDQELDFQHTQMHIGLGRHLGQLRDLLTLTTQIILAILVGMLVISMYLPIFKLGRIF